MDSFMNWQDQGFCGTEKQSAQAALKQANEEINAARANTPEDRRGEYRGQIRWEGDGYGWYWVIRDV